MAIRIKNNKAAEKTTVQFVLPADVHNGPVSAVGTFNDWDPKAHRLVRRTNGTISVSVAVPAGQELKFRYLGSGGVWFDDPEVTEVCAEGGLVRV
jgi:1,4-alpha-glucan branching enzyme